MRSSFIVALCLFTIIVVLADLFVVHSPKVRAAGSSDVHRLDMYAKSHVSIPGEITALSCVYDTKTGNPICFAVVK